MISSVDLQELSQKQAKADKSKNNQASHLTKIYHLLSTSKNCGLLILINKLLKGNASQKQCFLAEEMLSLLHRCPIAVFPEENDNPLAFVTQLIEQAKLTTIHPTPNEDINSSAQALINDLESHAADQQNIHIIEDHWKYFAFYFFKEKIKALTKR